MRITFLVRAPSSFFRCMEESQALFARVQDTLSESMAMSNMLRSFVCNVDDDELWDGRRFHRNSRG